MDTFDEISLAIAGIEPYATIYGFDHDWEHNYFENWDMDFDDLWG